MVQIDEHTWDYYNEIDNVEHFCDNYVPKSVVHDDHHKQVACYTLGCREGDKIKREVAREIFEEIEKSFIKYYDEIVTYSSLILPYHTRQAAGFALNEMFTKIAELKKKYTEGCGDEE